MTGNGTGDPEALREEIRRTRVELGETVEALAAKVDVKARLREQAEQAKVRVREQAGQAKDRVREQAGQAKVRVREQAGQVRSQAALTVAKVRGQATQTAGTARAQAQGTGTMVRRDPVPWAVVAAGALATVVVLLIVRGRRR
ncbi:hypothetical protein GCM10017556_45860 [Micromonospora sagamiensis]|uniref:Uncharacterized protein DUF3618 n=1 Tax=Micromonospora sagamiensis TaxID=47875 RepID=A0A562WIY0_9ACTN|nr:DUF3618 domain-containing protein [Micromonospora sagamiensis]TWJ30122.1 uncharacterized protein DUF3618 [Micromonospora sagamiensis]BCL16847.1 hypothetical protein GCM10017556_45860 [Micromonospora sagamiensis]